MPYRTVLTEKNAEPRRIVEHRRGKLVRPPLSFHTATSGKKKILGFYSGIYYVL